MTRYRLALFCLPLLVFCAEGFAWPRTIDRSGPDNGVFVGIDIAIRHDGRPIVSYSGRGIGLAVFDCDSLACVSGTARNFGLLARAAGPNSIAIRQDGRPIISFHNESAGSLNIFDCVDIACSDGDIHPLALDSSGLANALLIRDNGLPLVFYEISDAPTYELRVFDCISESCDDGVWRTLDEARVVHGLGLATRSDGRPVVSYYDADSGELWMYNCDNADCSAGNAQFVADGVGRVGEYSSVGVRSSDRPFITYFDGFDVTLNAFSCTSTTCDQGTSATLDGTQRTGWHTSLILREGDLPLVSYFDQGEMNLNRLTCDDPNCSTRSIRVLDSGGDVGRNSSIAVGVDGRPMIAYYDQTNTAIKLFRCASSRCDGIFFVDGFEGSAD